MTKSVKRTNPMAPEKLSLPGISITELLDFEDIFQDIRLNIATIMVPVVIIAQIRVALDSSKPTVVQNLDSVNTYVRSILAKSVPLTYVTAAVAIRRTALEYALDPDPVRMINDHKDLSTNLSGQVTTRGGINANLGDPTRLRAYRRGLMAQVTGQLQATPLHSPRRLSRTIEKIDKESFLSSLPFNTSDLNVDQVITTVNSLIDPIGDGILFVDVPAIPTGGSLLETCLNVQRTLPDIPDTSSVSRLDSLPNWKKAAITQARNVKEGR